MEWEEKTRWSGEPESRKNGKLWKRENIGSWELMVVIKGLFVSCVIAINEDHWNDCKWHHFRTNPQGKNCCCTKRYEEVEKRTKRRKFIPIFYFNIFCTRFFVGGELKYFHTHSLPPSCSTRHPQHFFHRTFVVVETELIGDESESKSKEL